MTCPPHFLLVTIYNAVEVRYSCVRGTAGELSGGANSLSLPLQAATGSWEAAAAGSSRSAGANMGSAARQSRQGTSVAAASARKRALQSSAEDEGDDEPLWSLEEEPAFEKVLSPFALEDLEDARQSVPEPALSVFGDYPYEFSGCEQVFGVDEEVVAEPAAEESWPMAYAEQDRILEYFKTLI